MTLEEEKAYLAYHENCGLKKGDVVKVLFRVSSYAGGWQNSWVEDMDSAIDKKYKINSDNRSGGFNLDEINFSFPAFCLERVEQPEEMVEIDGRSWSISTIKEALRNYIG